MIIEARKLHTNQTDLELHIFFSINKIKYINFYFHLKRNRLNNLRQKYMPGVKDEHHAEINEIVENIIKHHDYNTLVSVFEIKIEGDPIDIEKSILNALRQGNIF